MVVGAGLLTASMKALPRRKGNSGHGQPPAQWQCLNESPSQKEGKSATTTSKPTPTVNLNESPSEKEGKCISKANAVKFKSTSMKAPPKRKGNLRGLGYS